MKPSTSPATGSNRVMTLASRLIVGSLLPRIDHAVEESRRPFRQPEMLRPNIHSKRYGWTHFGIFLPNLPAPFRYCNLMTLLGSTGTVMFDNDYLVSTNPRDTATVLSSTALGASHLYRGYSIRQECETQEDGSQIRFGDNLEIRGSYPHYEVTAAYDDFHLELTISCTDTVSWFVRNLAYDHLSLLATCKGTITQGGQTIKLDNTLCTFEYARCVSPHALVKRSLPEAWKVPADFFTYQIINLDDSTQLLLTDVRSLGRTAFKGVHMRTLKGEAEVYVENVELSVLEYEPERAVAPDGRSMRLPRVFTWIVHAGGTTLLELRCTIDAPWRFGHGRGYVSCYRFEGTYQGRAQSGSGYIEYVDCETA